MLFFLKGLYKEDFHSLDNYVTFAYPRFGETVEEAEDALALLHDETDDQLEHHEQGTSTTSTRRGSTSSTSSLNISSSSAAYLSSNEFSDSQPLSATAGPSDVSSLTTDNQTQLSLDLTVDEKLKNLNISHPSTSSLKPASETSTEETDDNKKAKQSSPVSSVSSGSGDQTDSDGSHSPLASFSSTSAPQTALSFTAPTTTTMNRTTSYGHSSTETHEFSAMFDDQSFLFSSGRYVLIYRRKNGDVLGISEPFEISVDSNDERQPFPGNDSD